MIFCDKNLPHINQLHHHQSEVLMKNGKVKKAITKLKLFHPTKYTHI